VGGRTGVDGEGEPILLTEVERVCLDLVGLPKTLGGNGHAALDGERQAEPVVVVGVLTDQVDPAGSERLDARRRHVRQGTRRAA
jgi:hypothetical protein